MAEAGTKKEERWAKMFGKLDLMSRRLDEIDEIQQQLVGQADLAATVAEQAAKERQVLTQQLAETGRVVADMRLERMAEELEKFSDDG